MFKIGIVTHYYDKIGVAIVELDGLLAVRDKVRFTKNGEYLFDQEITEIQVGHKKLESANKGTLIGIKTREAVPEGTEIFKL